MLDWTRVNKGRAVIGVSGVKIDKMKARSQDFSWGGGGCMWAVKMQTCSGVRGHAPPGKF